MVLRWEVSKEAEVCSPVHKSSMVVIYDGPASRIVSSKRSVLGIIWSVYYSDAASNLESMEKWVPENAFEKPGF